MNAVERVQDLGDRILGEATKVVQGQDEALRLLIVGLLVRGHVLLEGVPGTAKTLMVKAVARAIDARFKRIQFTPDLMPSDILGTSVFNLQSRSFELHRGPVFTDLLLGDEINRAPAKTQSALLEAMEERRVTLEGEAHRLPRIFTVFATQNPVESEGTYPLPEAQLDRFTLKVRVDYPLPVDELEVLRRYDEGFDAHDLEGAGVHAVATEEDLIGARGALAEIRTEPAVLEYVRGVVAATRQSDRLSLGAGPRGSSHLLLCSTAMAALAGRDFATPDDVREAALPVLRHRVVLSPEAELDGADPDDVLLEVMSRVEVPR